MEIPSESIRKQMFLNQNPMKIPSEPIRQRKFFNQNPMEIPSEPIRKDRICQNFCRSLGGWSRFLVYYCQSDHPPLLKKKDRGGAFTIVVVDATLQIDMDETWWNQCKKIHATLRNTEINHQKSPRSGLRGSAKKPSASCASAAQSKASVFTGGEWMILGDRLDHVGIILMIIGLFRLRVVSDCTCL